MVNIIDYKKFDTNRLEYYEPTKVKGGSYVASIKYRGENNELSDVIIQTPRLICDTGIVKTETRSYLELDFDKEHWLFYEFITDIDDHNIVITEKNSETWFQKKFPLDVVEEFYKSPVKPGRGKNSPKIKVKLPVSKGKLECGIYDNNKNVIHHSDITGNSKMICVLKLIGLRFLKQQVICEWYPIQIRVCDIEAKIPRSYLIDDSLLSDNEEVPTELETPVPVPEEVVEVVPEEVAEAVVETPVPEEVSEEVSEEEESPFETTEFTVENLDDTFVNEEDIEKIHEEKLAEFDKNNVIAELTEKINFLEQEVTKRDSLIEKFKSLLN